MNKFQALENIQESLARIEKEITDMKQYDRIALSRMLYSLHLYDVANGATMLRIFGWAVSHPLDFLLGYLPGWWRFRQKGENVEIHGRD